MSGLSVLAGVGASAAGSYVNYKMQESLMDKSNEQYNENSKLAYLRQRRMAEDSTPLAVMGMREAGLNPSSLSEPMAAGSVSSVPYGNTPQAPSVSVAQDALLAAQVDNVNAQTEKTRVETQNLEDENATADVNLRRHFQSLLDDPNISADDRKFYQSIVENSSNYSAGSLKGLKDYFALRKDATDTLFNDFDKQYKKMVLDANIRNDVPEWLSKLPQEQFNEVVQKIGNIQANTLLLASEAALNSDKADKLRAEIQKDYAEMKHVYHQDWSSMWENKDYWSLFMGFTEKVLPAIVQGAAFGKAFKSTPKGFTPLSSGSPAVGRLPNGKLTPLGAAYEIKAGGKPKLNAVAQGIYKTFKNDKDRTAFLSLVSRRGSDVANQSFHQWIASPYRKKYSYADWLGLGERYHR